nr:hypothetical protein [Tanacetum cinerariifolium]
HPPHPTYETYSHDSYGNDSQFGYDFQPQFSLHYESKLGYNENYNSYPYDSSSLPQQYLCCARCGGPHETFHCDQLIFDEPYFKHCGGPHMNYQCQPMNQDSYNSNSLGSDQPQPPQSLVIHQPPQELSIQEMEDLKQHTHPSKRLTSFCYDDDDDEDYTSAITPNESVLSTEEPDNSLSMRDEHLDTISAMESDAFIKSGVKDLISIPSEFKGIPEHKCDVPSHDNSPPLDVSTDRFEDFFESNEEFSSTDDDSFSIDDIDYVEASHLDSELVSSNVMEIVIPEVGGIEASNDNPIRFYDPIISGTPLNLSPSEESDFFLERDMLLLEAFLNDDHSSDFKTKSSSTSLNSLLEETNNFDNSLPEFTTFSKKLLYDNSSPRPPKEFVSANSDAKIKSYSPPPILVKDSDSLIEEIDLFCTPNYPMPPGIEDKDYDSKRDILILKDFPRNHTLSFAKKESFHFDIPSTILP